MAPKALIVFLLDGKEIATIDIYAMREAEDKKKYDYDVIYRKRKGKNEEYDIVSVSLDGATSQNVRKLTTFNEIKISETDRSKEIEINLRSNVKVLNNRLRLLPFSERTLKKLNTKKDNSISAGLVLASTSNLSVIPPVEELQRLICALAVLDILLKPLENRVYFFDGHYGKKETVGSLQHHDGEHFYILFKPVGTVIKGYGTKCIMNPDLSPHGEVWEGVLNELPSEFKEILEDSFFESDYTTFCTWKLQEERKWNLGNINFPNDRSDPDGSKSVLEILSTTFNSYTFQLRREFGRLIDFEPIKKIFEGKPLTKEMVKKITGSETLPEYTLNDLKETGYPLKLK